MENRCQSLPPSVGPSATADAESRPSRFPPAAPPEPSPFVKMDAAAVAFAAFASAENGQAVKAKRSIADGDRMAVQRHAAVRRNYNMQRCRWKDRNLYE